MCTTITHCIEIRSKLSTLAKLKISLLWFLKDVQWTNRHPIITANTNIIECVAELLSWIVDVIDVVRAYGVLVVFSSCPTDLDYSAVRACFCNILSR